MTTLLFDIDSLLWQSGYCKKEEDPQGEGYVRDVDTAIYKFEEGIFRVFSELEETYGMPVDKYKFFVGGYNNFRKVVTTSYKCNRSLTTSPPTFEALKNHAIIHWNAYECNGVEADDVVAATWRQITELDFEGSNNVIVASIDKDYKQLPCLFFDYYHKRFNLVQIQPNEASFNFYKQMLMGDSSDGIKGVKGVGKDKADKILGQTSEYGYFRRAYAEYVKRYGRKSREEWIINHMLLTLHTNNVETPSLEEFNEMQ